MNDSQNQANDVKLSLSGGDEVRRSKSGDPMPAGDADGSDTPGLVFLLDVDNTLLNNDPLLEELHEHLVVELGEEKVKVYWDIFEKIRDTVGYADYLGAIQQYRLLHPHESDLFRLSQFLLDYPFSLRVLPDSLPVLSHLRKFGETVLLTDGDVVFQPRKLQRSGLLDAVEGRAMVCVHKELELAMVEKHYPARHYVLVDDKLRILSAVKATWGDKVTTVFIRQGHYANEPGIEERFPAPDLKIDSIGELLTLEIVDNSDGGVGICIGTESAPA